MQGASAGLTIRIEGVFDVPAARRVCELLGSPLADGRVAVDLTHVSEFHDPGLAVLAEALAAAGPSRVALHGLRQRQVRMLRYLGAAPAAIGAAERPVERA
jgi:hypothetical protein